MAFLAPIAAFAAANAGTIAAVTSVLGAGVTAMGAIQQGQYQAAVAKNNAIIAEQNAARLSEASQESAKRSDIEMAALLGEQYAAQGASGLDVEGRSARSARMLTRRVSRQAAKDIVTQGSSDARNQLQEAANFRAEGKQAKRQGMFTAAGALLGAAGDIASRGSMLRGGRRQPWDRSENWYRRG